MDEKDEQNETSHFIGYLIGWMSCSRVFVDLNSITRIGFGFVPLVMVAILFGPVYAALQARWGTSSG
jgi:hypothetical protein